MLTKVNTIQDLSDYTQKKSRCLILSNRLEIIGSNIREIRKKQNLLQIDLAVMVGIDRAYLSEIENGKTNVSISLLYAIADALREPIINIIPK